MTGKSPTTEPASTAPERVAAQLRDELLNGQYAAGTRLREEELSERFEVGRHTVRAAIRLLVERGLIIHERNRGAIVPPLTQQRIDEICGFRMVLEIGALRMALANGADLSPVNAVVEELEGLVDSDPAPSWRELTEVHGRIHRAIVVAADNSHLLAAYGPCEDETRILLAVLQPDFDARRLAVLHRELMDKLLIGGEVAVQALADDLELGGRAALLVALHRAETVARALSR
ncbi:GntR family transcriptional regulator [Lentzea sp. NPDC051213]|uniref:GntR family transcriptional regulator n=1 Tax=Lentzea sp. NPDC051213 TaxID=3364126 RepID=UPI00378B3E93